MQISNHILSKEGILTSFSIAKKVTVKDMKKLCNKLKNSNVNDEKFQELLKESVIKKTKKSIDVQKIPGLILNGIFAENEEKKKIMELTYFASIIAKKLTEKKIDKYYSCYIINAIVNMLGLTEEDFEKFHKKFAKFKEGGSENEEDEQLD